MNKKLILVLFIVLLLISGVFLIKKQYNKKEVNFTKFDKEKKNDKTR